MKASHVLMRLAIGALLILGSRNALAKSKDAHLLPVESKFDVGPPIEKTYARVCEQMLFGERNWLLRYYSASESVTTGLSISKELRGRYWLSIRQARPQLGSVVANALSRKLDLKAELATIKITEAHAEIPQAVALAVSRLWLSLLHGVKTDEALQPYILSAQVMLYARTAEGRVLEGKMPPAFFKDKRLASVEDIVDDLIKVCVEPEKRRKGLFVRIEQNASSFRKNR